MPAPDLPNYHHTRLVISLQWDFQKLRVVPKGLSFREINAVFGLVGITFSLVEFELHDGALIIPFLSLSVKA